MTIDMTGRRPRFWLSVKPLALLSLACCCRRFPPARPPKAPTRLPTPATFEREVMTSTLQGLDLVPQGRPRSPTTRPRGPLVMPKADGAAAAADQATTDTAMLPADSNNPQIDTAGLSEADIDSACATPASSTSARSSGRPLTDAERKQLTARMQAANMQVSADGNRPLTLPPVYYFTDYKGKARGLPGRGRHLVSVNDPKCPDEIRKALRQAGPQARRRRPSIDAGHVQSQARPRRQRPVLRRPLSGRAICSTGPAECWALCYRSLP